MWHLWENPYAHAHTALHLVLAPARHISHVREMKEEDWIALSQLVGFAVDEYDLPGGCVAMRFGDPALNAGSIRHLHCNIIVPDGTGNVKVTLAKDAEKQAENIDRVRVFEKLRQANFDSRGALDDKRARVKKILQDTEVTGWLPLYRLVADRI